MKKLDKNLAKQVSGAGRPCRPNVPPEECKKVKV